MFFSPQWEVSAVLQGHQGAVNSVAAISVSLSNKETRIVIASASANSTVRIWDRKRPEGPFTKYNYIAFSA